MACGVSATEELASVDVVTTGVGGVTSLEMVLVVKLVATVEEEVGPAVVCADESVVAASVVVVISVVATGDVSVTSITDSGANVGIGGTGVVVVGGGVGGKGVVDATVVSNVLVTTAALDGVDSTITVEKDIVVAGNAVVVGKGVDVVASVVDAAVDGTVETMDTGFGVSAALPPRLMQIGFRMPFVALSAPTPWFMELVLIHSEGLVLVSSRKR